MTKAHRLLLTVALLVGGTSLATASPAQADSCSGQLVGSHVYANGYAQVDVYWNGTTNCLINRTRGDSWGEARWMGVGVKAGSTPGAPSCARGTSASTTRLNCGNFRYYAGPVRVSTQGCITFWASVVKANGNQDSANWTGRHCG